jgi:hypothetical protein
VVGVALAGVGRDATGAASTRARRCGLGPGMDEVTAAARVEAM